MDRNKETLNDIMRRTNGSDSTELITREEYRIDHGDIGLYAIDRIVPLRSEREALTDIPEDEDVREHVPWEAGIGMHLVLLKSRDADGEVRQHATVGDDGEVDLPYGHSGMNMYVQVSLHELTQGWLRKYNRERRRIIYELPDRWDEMNPQERFAFWREVIAGRYGLHADELKEGTTFYTYLVKQRTRDDRTFTKIQKIYRDESGRWQDRCPAERGHIDIATLRAIKAKITEAYRAERDAAGDNPFNSPPATEDDEREAGF